jgi:YggT family protein
MDTGLIGVVFDLLRVVLRLLSTVLIVHVVISWLFAFDIVSRRNQFVGAVWRFTSAIAEPLVRPLRRMIPSIGGVDLSVLVLLIGIWFAERLSYWVQGVLTGSGPVL